MNISDLVLFLKNENNKYWALKDSKLKVIDTDFALKLKEFLKTQDPKTLIDLTRKFVKENLHTADYVYAMKEVVTEQFWNEARKDFERRNEKHRKAKEAIKNGEKLTDDIVNSACGRD
jgi:hypothetical protein